MKHLLKALFIALALAISPAMAQKVGQVQSVKGTARIQVPEGSMKVASPGTAVNEGSTILTSSGAVLILRLNNGSTLTVNPGSRLKVVSSQVKSGQGSSYGFNLNAGTISAKVAKLSAKNEQFQVYTPTTVAGVRGTDFSVSTAKDGSSIVTVDEGKVNVGNGDSDTDVDAGEGASAVLGDENLGKDKASDKDREKFLEDRQKEVSEDPAGVLAKMQEHLASVESDADSLAEDVEEAKEGDLPDDASALDNEKDKARDLDNESQRLKAGNQGMYELAIAIAEEYQNNPLVQKNLSEIKDMSERIEAVNLKIDAGLAEVDARVAEAMKKIDDDFDDASDQIDSQFDDLMKNFDE